MWEDYFQIDVSLRTDYFQIDVSLCKDYFQTAPALPFPSLALVSVSVLGFFAFDMALSSSVCVTSFVDASSPLCVTSTSVGSGVDTLVAPPDDMSPSSEQLRH